MLQRRIEQFIDTYITGDDHKILFIWGPRRSGKTTLLKKYSQKYQVPIFNFDLYSEQEKLAPKKELLEKVAKEHKLILIDEVQNFPQSTLSLKILNDEFGVKVIATGSSELRKITQEFDTLAGRYKELYCFPFSYEEIVENLVPRAYEEKELYQRISIHFQIFGAYPEVYLQQKESSKIDLLQNLLDTYVLKDIIDIYNLKNAKLAKDILMKIALQIGAEVSIREIASSLSANVATVANYIEIFIKNHILIPLPSFKINLRRAVSQHRKLYFADLGIRNILVRDFRPLSFRPDKGCLFENFIIAELEKRRKIYRLQKSMYFYREYGGKEVDLVIEDYKKRYICVELKLTEKKIRKVFPLTHRLEVINEENYFEKIPQVLLLENT